MVAASCPSRETLLQYSTGMLSDEQSDDLAGHLDSCPDCQATIMTLEDAEDTLIRRLRMPLASESCLAEPEFQAALAEAVAMPAAGVAQEASASEGNLAPAMPPTLGEYQVLEELGHGGMGRVYKALHTKLDRVVTLKVLPRGRVEDPQAIARFEREMRAVGQLAHPNIVQAFDAREIDGTPVLIMEFVDGLDLAELVRRVGPLPVAEACELVRQTALGLQRAHEHGLVHRDIKPSNIMLTGMRAESGKRKAESGQTDGRGETALRSPLSAFPSSLTPPQVKLLDLGLARFYAETSGGEEMTGTGQAMGTADYMAPEQASDSRTVDIRADIYSLGCTLYKLLSGRAPFGGPEHRGTLDKMNAHVHESAPPIRQFAPEVPEELAAILDRMLAKDPDDRFATPAEAAAVLEPFCTGANLLSLWERVRARDEQAESGPLSDSEGARVEASQAESGPLSLRERVRVRADQAPERRRPTIKTLLIGLGFLGAIAAAFAAGVLITINKNGEKYQVEVPKDSATVVDESGNVTVNMPVKAQGGKPPAVNAGKGATETPGRLRFDFRAQPWRDVLKWLAEQAELSLMGSPPSGVFTYIDSRVYTPAEAIDLVNGVLLVKGYTLIQRDRTLMVIDLSDGTARGLIPVVPLETLDTRGEYEFVSVLITLDKADPEAAQAEARSIVGSHGSVALLRTSRQIMVTDAAGRVRAIRGALKRIETAKPASFRTATVTRGDVVATVSATGTVQAEDYVDVAAKVAGQIVSFGEDPRGATDPRFKGKSIDFNSPVEADTVLARIDDAIYRARVEQEQAGLARARAELTVAQTKREPTDVARATILAAQAAVAQSEAALRQAQINLSSTVITSPIKGVIIVRRVNVGQNVGPDPNAPGLFLIAKDLTKLQVWASVNEADIGRIHEGTEARFSVDGFPKEVFKGKVAQVRLNAQMTQNVVLYTVVVTFDNADMRLRPYLTANLQFDSASARNVLRVPNTSLRWKPRPDLVAPYAREAAQTAEVRGSYARVWAKDKDGEHVRPVGVQFGVSDGSVTEVSGPEVKEGTEVIVGEGPSAARAGTTPAVNPPGVQATPNVSYIRRFPQGTVELVGISNDPPTGEVWWAPDGSAINVGPFQPGSAFLPISTNEQARTFLFRFKDLPGGASWPAWKVEPFTGYEGQYRVLDANGRIAPEYKMLASRTGSARTAHFQVGIAMGKWETVARWKPGSARTTNFSREGKQFSLEFQQAAAGSTPDSTRITIRHLAKSEMNVRLVAIDNDGKEHENELQQASTSEGGDAVIDFAGLPLSSVKELQYQVRPYSWVTFRNVSLNLLHTTATLVEPQEPTEAKPPAVSPAAELKALQGQWKVVRVEKGKDAASSWAAICQFGSAIDPGNMVHRFDFNFNQLSNREQLQICENPAWLVMPGNEPTFVYRIDPTASPKTIDLVHDAGAAGDRLAAVGIYAIESDRLRICLASHSPSVTSDQRPRSFSVGPGSVDILFDLERHRLSEDEKTIRGDWRVAVQVEDGKPVAEESLRNRRWWFPDLWGHVRITDKTADGKQVYLGYGQYLVDAAKQPKTMKIVTYHYVDETKKSEKREFLGIYTLDGGRLSIAYRQGGPAPEKFESLPGSGVTLLVLQRREEPKAAVTPGSPPGVAREKQAPPKAKATPGRK